MPVLRKAPRRGWARRDADEAGPARRATRALCNSSRRLKPSTQAHFALPAVPSGPLLREVPRAPRVAESGAELALVPWACPAFTTNEERG